MANSNMRVNWPEGAADATTLTWAASLVIPQVNNRKTIITVGTATADTTVTVTVGANIAVGAELLVKIPNDGTIRTITWSTGFTAPALAGVANKTRLVSFVYDGTNFILQSSVQIN